MSFLDNFNKEKRRISQNISSTFNAPEPIQKSNDSTSLNPKDVISKNLNKTYSSTIEKGKSVPIGTVHNGYKK